MNGVDLADQYTVYSKIKKNWWKKMCFWLQEVVTVKSTYCSNLPTIPVVLFSSEGVLLNHWPNFISGMLLYEQCEEDFTNILLVICLLLVIRLD